MEKRTFKDKHLTELEMGEMLVDRGKRTPISFFVWILGKGFDDIYIGVLNFDKFDFVEIC